MGEMFAYYAASDLAFIGGSLLPLGGQNLIEACAVGIAVLIGPHTFNFAEATEQALAAGAARRVSDAPQLLEVAAELLGDADARLRMGRAGEAIRRQAPRRNGEDDGMRGALSWQPARRRTARPPRAGNGLAALGAFAASGRRRLGRGLDRLALRRGADGAVHLAEQGVDRLDVFVAQGAGGRLQPQLGEQRVVARLEQLRARVE